MMVFIHFAYFSNSNFENFIFITVYNYTFNLTDHKSSSVSIKSASNYRPENCGFLFCCSTENQTDQLTIRYIFWQSRSIQGNR